MRTNTFFLFGLFAIVSLCAGCGGGGSTVGPAGNGPVSTGTTISGVASKGIIKGGRVDIYAPPASGDLGSKILLKSTSTDQSGGYSANLGSYTGVVLVEVSGSYTDEATGASTTIAADAPLRAAQVIGSAGGTVTASVTPLTELATRKALLGTVLTASAVQTANTLVSNLFQFDVVGTRPVEPGVTAMNAASQVQRDYTLALAGISKQAATAGSVGAVLSTWSQELAATNRLSSTSVTNLQNSVTSFLADSTHNLTGVSTLPSGVADIGKYTGTLYLATQGSATAPVKSIQVTLALPTGVTVKQDSGGNALVSLTGVALQAAAPAVNNNSPGTLILGIISTPGFGLGQFAAITYVAQPGTIPVAGDFHVTSQQITGFDGTQDFDISTATVVPVLP